MSGDAPFLKLELHTLVPNWLSKTADKLKLFYIRPYNQQLKYKIIILEF